MNWALRIALSWAVLTWAVMEGVLWIQHGPAMQSLYHALQ